MPSPKIVPAVRRYDAYGLRLTRGGRGYAFRYHTRPGGVCVCLSRGLFLSHLVPACRTGRPLLRGVLHRIETLPSSVNAPDANWDLEVVDRWGDDLLAGQGQNRSANIAEAVFPRILPGTTGHGEKGIGERLSSPVQNPSNAPLL